MAKQQQLRALVTGVGSNIGQGILKALRLGFPDPFVVGTDARSDSVGLLACDRSFCVPPAESPDYSRRMLEILKAEQLQVVLIGSDAEVMPWSRLRSEVEAGSGCRVIVCSEAVATSCIDKWATVSQLRQAGIAQPESWAEPSVESFAGFVERVGFPLVVKPRFGQGSKWLSVVHDESLLRACLERLGLPIVQQLVGRAEEEFTVAVLTDFDGTSQSCLAMRRRLEHGTTVRVEIDAFPEVERAAIQVVAALGARGPINVQLRATEQGPVCFEVNPRFSGTAAMRALAGWNDVEAAVRAVLWARPVALARPPRSVVCRFYDEVVLPATAEEPVGRLLQSRLFGA